MSTTTEDRHNRHQEESWTVIALLPLRLNAKPHLTRNPNSNCSQFVPSLSALEAKTSRANRTRRINA